MLVCVLVDIESTVILCIFLCICPGADILATVTPIGPGMNFCMMVELDPRKSFCPFSGYIFRGL